MKRCPQCAETKSASEFPRNRRSKDGLASACKPCSYAYRKAWAARNAEYVRATNRAYCAANVERQRAKTRAWAAANPERKKETDREYARANKDRLREQNAHWRQQNAERISENRVRYAEENREAIRKRQAAWRRANHGKVLADRAYRKARKRQATPSWLTQEHRTEMAAFYVRAAELAEQTGEAWHVDHIVPLCGANVCGLHVPWNLQVLPARENILKSNRHET